MLQKSSKQNGNVLFLILIAVVLFAALSYAVTQSTRTSSDGTGQEDAALTTSQIFQYATNIEQAVRRVQILNGCGNREISFENTIDLNYENTNSPDNNKCHIFDPAGGGLNFAKGPEGTGDANGYPLFIPARIAGIGENLGISRELSMYFPIRSESVCAEINRRLELPSDYAIDGIVSAGALDTWKYKGQNGAGNLIPDEAGNISGFTGKMSACIQTTSDASQYPASEDIPYFYYHVLIVDN